MWINYHTKGSHPSFGKRDYIEAISNVIGGFGAERLHSQTPSIHYVNMGDSYATTIIMKSDNLLYLGCYADIVENNLGNLMTSV